MGTGCLSAATRKKRRYLRSRLATAAADDVGDVDDVIDVPDVGVGGVGGVGGATGAVLWRPSVVAAAAATAPMADAADVDLGDDDVDADDDAAGDALPPLRWWRRPSEPLASPSSHDSSSVSL